MRTWTTTTTVDADPDAVLDVLTDPEAVRGRAPVAFDVSGRQDDRLPSGSSARPAPPAKPVVGGRLAGRSVGFDVHVHEAVAGRLALSADGPVAPDVRYDLAEATSALLSAGALDTAVSRLARQAVVTC